MELLFLRNNIDSLMQSGATGYFTTSLISYVGSLLNCPVTVSGFIQGLDKLVPTTSVDIESLRRFHPTVLFAFFLVCRMSIAASICLVISTPPCHTWLLIISALSLLGFSTYQSCITSFCSFASQLLLVAK